MAPLDIHIELDVCKYSAMIRTEVKRIKNATCYTMCATTDEDVVDLAKFSQVASEGPLPTDVA